MGRSVTLVLVATIALVAALAPSAAAQQAAEARVATLVGTVADAQGRPLPGAHVYVAGSLRGTITDAQGRYRLGDVPLGAHRVAASMLGYRLATEDVVLREAREHTVDFTLREAVYEMTEVAVDARSDRRWQRRYERFVRALVGQSTFADSVTILNPEVLDFSDRFGRLTASAREPLVIENRALGYRIRYDLEVFEATDRFVRYHGEELFEELEPADEAEAARWAEARRRAYEGSLRHLLRALLAGDPETEGFILTLRPDEGPNSFARISTPTGLPPRRRPVWPEALLRPTDHVGEYRLAFRGLLEVHYDREPEDDGIVRWDWNVERRSRPDPFQRSEIYVTGRSALIDARGEPADPFAITRRGYLAFRRLAMLLPVEYGL
jgi:hypothetical protein